jgi:hypothetical protein
MEQERGGSGASPSGLRAGGRGFELGYTREISTKVHCLSLTFLLAFEWNCKMLKNRGLEI